MHMMKIVCTRYTRKMLIIHIIVDLRLHYKWPECLYSMVFIWPKIIENNSNKEHWLKYDLDLDLVWNNRIINGTEKFNENFTIIDGERNVMQLRLLYCIKNQCIHVCYIFHQLPVCLFHNKHTFTIHFGHMNMDKRHINEKRRVVRLCIFVCDLYCVLLCSVEYIGIIIIIETNNVTNVCALVLYQWNYERQNHRENLCILSS